MRIDDLALQLVKGKDSVRLSTGSRKQTVERTSSGATTDEVSLSSLALIAGGAGTERVAELHRQVADQSYMVPALDVSRSIINYSLGA